MRNVYSVQEHQAKAKVPTTLNENIGTIAKINRESIQKLNEAAQGKPKKLIVQMEAIHVGRTKNFTYYTKEGLSAGLDSWTTPRQKPVLTHHNDHDGEPIGRIIKAEFHDITMSGKAGLMFTVEITDPVAIEKVLDGRYQTVSIGANTDKVTCNICGTDRTKEWCDHYPGDEYESQTAHLIIGTTYGREVSYVNVPADEFAGNTSVEAVHDEQGALSASQESVHMEIFQLAEGLLQHIDSPDYNLYDKMNESQRRAINSLFRFEERSNDMDEEGTPAGESAATTTPVTEGNQTTETPATIPATTEANLEPAAAVPAATPVTEAAAVSAPVAQLTESEKVNQLNSTIANLVLESQKTSTRLAEAQDENIRLTTENATLHKELHKVLAEKVVNLKRTLGKPDVAGVEQSEAVSTHAARSKESLENTLVDLLAEQKSARPEAGSVANPGLNTEDEQQDYKKMTVNEADSIIKSMFRRKS